MSHIAASENLNNAYFELFNNAANFETMGVNRVHFGETLVDAVRLGLIDENNCLSDFHLTTAQFNAVMNNEPVRIGSEIRNSCMDAIAEKCRLELGLAL